MYPGRYWSAYSDTEPGLAPLTGDYSRGRIVESRVGQAPPSGTWRGRRLRQKDFKNENASDLGGGVGGRDGDGSHADWSCSRPAANSHARRHGQERSEAAVYGLHHESTR